VPDDILRQVTRNGGVVMVTFVPGFVSQEVADYNARENAERARLTAVAGSTPEGTTQGVDQWRVANPAPRATIIQVADHIDHIRKVAGVDHVGLGGDFDGITQVVMGLEDVSTYPDLIAELLRRGYSDEDVRKIAGRNMLRVFKRAEQVAGK
jgi:membrane dipeptidase